MPWDERAAIVAALHVVDRVFEFDDADGSSCAAIEAVKLLHPNHEIIFANGGDRTAGNIPEIRFEGVEFAFGVGGSTKKNSSSWILEEWKSPKTFREWGMYRVIYSDEIIGTHTKVKELVVEPGKKLSMQRHQFRSEHWHVVTGVATVYSINRTTTDLELLGKYHAHESVHIFSNKWHQLVNETSELLKIVEIQYGSVTEETDIERKPG